MSGDVHSSAVVGAAVAVAMCCALSPYLARLTVSAPDRTDRAWWCGQAASRRRQLVTAAVATAFGAMAGTAAGFSALLPALIALAALGAPLTVIDFEHHRLPDRLVFTLAAKAALLLTLAAAIRHDLEPLVRAAAGSLAVFGVLFAIAFIAPGAFGFGDVKLGAVLGGYLGWYGWMVVYYGILAGFVLGAVVGIALLATRRATMKAALPFGPMLIVGALAVLAVRY